MSAQLATARDALRDLVDPLDVLELVHAGAKHLQELAGPAVIVTIVPAAELEEAPPEERATARGPAGPTPAADESRLSGSNGSAPPPQPRQQGGLTRKQEAAERLAERVEDAKQFLARNGESSPAEVRDALGLQRQGSATAVKTMRAVADDPDVVTTGATRGRRYSLRPGAPALNRRRVATKPMLKSAGAKNDPRQQPTLDGQVMSALVLERTVADVAETLDADLLEISEIIERLAADGDVVPRPGHRWLAVP